MRIIKKDSELNDTLNAINTKTNDGLNNKSYILNTKEEILSLLNKSKLILSDYINDYLKSLIELDFSVMREYISEDARQVLSELEIYKKIAIYNIYYRALNIFVQSGKDLKILVNKNEIEGLKVASPLGRNNIQLFDFNYQNEHPKSQMSNDYKTMHIGNISLFQTIENIEQREAELIRIMSVLDKLHDEPNPYSLHGLGGYASLWEFEHNRKISYYEEIFQKLDEKKELTDEEKREIEITNLFHEQLLKDYGLTNESFEETNNNSIINRKSQSELRKILVRREPNFTIENHIKYI